jgi:dolichol kinase
VVGSLYGRARFWPSGKSLEGYVGCFIASATASHAAFIWQSTPESATAMLGKAAIAGLCAAVAEGIDVGGWDDNLSLPLLSALFMVCGRLTLGII